MYCLSNFCCCCLKKRKHLTNINTLDTDDISFKDKFTYCQLETIDDDVPQLLCQKCCKSLQFMYQFKRAHSNRQKLLQDYITKLKSTNCIDSHSTLQINVLNVDPFIPIYKKHNNDLIIKEELATEINLISNNDNKSYTIKKLSNVDQNDEIVKKLKPETINNDTSSQVSEDSFTDNNNYEIVKANKIDKIHIKNDKIVKNLDPEILNNDTSSQTSVDSQDETNFADNNSYEIVKVNKIDKIHIKNDKIIKKPEPEIINNETDSQISVNTVNNNYEIVKNGDDNVLKIVRKKDDLKITLRRSSMNEESNSQPLTCIFCDSTFDNNKLLRKHERTHHNQSYECKICSRMMYNKYTYRIHFGKHSGEYKYRCNVCNKGLSSKQYLMKHKLIHFRQLKKNKQTNDKSVTVEKDETTQEGAEKDQVTLENNLDRKSPIRINIKRNKIISNTAVKKRGRPKIVQRRIVCAMCQRYFSHPQKLFRHLRVMHNYRA